MGEVVNLNRARKAKARGERAAEAAANRAKFGRTKVERAADAADELRRSKLLDGAVRSDDAS